MAELMHEYWLGEDGAEFSIVGERNDMIRPAMMPDGRRVFSVRAATWHSAMQLQYDRLELGNYDTGGMEDIVYTDEEAIEQQRYLARRNVS